MAGKARIRSVDTLMSAAVAETVANLDLSAEDVAAVRLAQRYAAAIDAAGADDLVVVLDRLGPKLVAVLDALGATPRARATLAKVPAPPVDSKLSALRSARLA